MKQRRRFSLRTLLAVMLVVACFFGGIRFERERQRRADEAARIAAELSAQERKVDRLMARFAALMDDERYREAESLAEIAEEIEPPTRKQPLLLPPLDLRSIDPALPRYPVDRQ